MVSEVHHKTFCVDQSSTRLSSAHVVSVLHIIVYRGCVVTFPPPEAAFGGYLTDA